MRGLSLMPRKRDFAENHGFSPLPHTGELARAALLLEGGGKDPPGQRRPIGGRRLKMMGERG